MKHASVTLKRFELENSRKNQPFRYHHCSFTLGIVPDERQKIEMSGVHMYVKPLYFM